MQIIKKVFGWVRGLFPSFEPLVVEPKMGPEQVLGSLHLLPKDYLDPEIMAIAQAVKDGNATILLSHMNNFRDVGEIKLEVPTAFPPKLLGTVCLIELTRIITENNESILPEIAKLNGLQKLKTFLKEDKDEAHTYWTLVFLSILCEKEESVNEALVHLQLQEILGALIKKHAESPMEFHIMVHQILGHMTMANSEVRKFYAKGDLFLSLIPLLDSADAGMVQSVLSIITVLLMSDDENDQDMEYIKTSFKELPIEGHLKEVKSKFSEEEKYPTEQKNAVIKACEQIEKLLN